MRAGSSYMKRRAYLSSAPLKLIASCVLLAAARNVQLAAICMESTAALLKDWYQDVQNCHVGQFQPWEIRPRNASHVIKCLSHRTHARTIESLWVFVGIRVVSANGSQCRLPFVAHDGRRAVACEQNHDRHCEKRRCA